MRQALSTNLQHDDVAPIRCSINKTTDLDLNVFFKLLRLAKQFQSQEVDKP